MSQTSIKIKLRHSTVVEKKSSIYIQFIKDRKVRISTTPYKIYKEEWNAAKSSICIDTSNSGREKYLIELSSSLKREVEELKTRIRNLEDSGDYTLDDIVCLYENRNHNIMLSTFVKKLKTELMNNLQERTADAYQTVVNNFIRFNSGKDLPLDEIDSSLMKKFETYMKMRGNSLNTISFYMRNLRAIYNKAIREDIFEGKAKKPFSDVYTGICKTKKRAVNKDVFDALSKLNLLEQSEEVNKNSIRNKSTKQLVFARDLFFLSFFLRGISFIDLAFLKKTDLSNNTISYIRRKTKQKLEIAITPEIKEIIDRYAEKTEDSDYLLPILTKGDARSKFINSLRYQNTQLKILSRMINLKENLTTYVARHSWASIARAKGYPIAIISQGLGHESEKTTMIYLDSFDYSNLHEANSKIISYTQAS